MSAWLLINHKPCLRPRRDRREILKREENHYFCWNYGGCCYCRNINCSINMRVFIRVALISAPRTSTFSYSTILMSRLFFCYLMQEESWLCVFSQEISHELSNVMLGFYHDKIFSEFKLRVNVCMPKSKNRRKRRQSLDLRFKVRRRRKLFRFHGTF